MDNKISIEYTQPKFWHRCLANLVDFIIFVFLFFTFFIISRTIVTHNESYVALDQRIDEVRLNSGLYMNTDDGLYEICSYAENYKDTSSKQKKIYASKAIDNFINYLSVNGDSDSYNIVKEEYTTYLNSFIIDGVPCFILDGDKLVENTECSYTDLQYYENIYKPYLTDKCYAYLTTYVGSYYQDIKMMSNMFLYVEFPISFVLGAVLTWLIPPIFFKRGRKTLGKALYHIGLVNEECLNPSFGKYTLRFIIFFFAELTLSLLTFGIPFIISFSMMSFSKKRQGFPDYMLMLTEVDNSKNKIYFDKVEIALDNDRVQKSPIDFNMEKPL